MRLSTATDRDDARSIAVIQAALDAGASLLDTSDAYCHDDRETGHNERLIASALASWNGDRSRIEIATKGGLRRPGGKWANDAKAKSLRAACDASRRALGVDIIDLYQLHAVDPKTPFETSVRALAALKDDGWIRRIGLCNVTVTQIEAARQLTEISTVQASLSPFDDENLRNGVAEFCRDTGIRLIAYRPLGGERLTRLARDPVVREVAARHEATP
jgi:aryl-alcohol dehydrogenase-like predicted oxidoreductase